MRTWRDLAPERLVAMIVGEPDVALDRLAGQERHDALFHLGNGLALAEDEFVPLARPRFLARLEGGDGDRHQLTRLRSGAFDRPPRGVLFPEAVELLADGLVGDRLDRAGESEAAGLLQGDGRADFDQQVELQGLSRLVLHLADLGIADRFEVGVLDDRVPAFTQRGFEDRLADLRFEPAAYHRFGDVPLAEPGNAGLGGEAADGARFECAEPVDIDGHVE